MISIIITLLLVIIYLLMRLRLFKKTLNELVYYADDSNWEYDALCECKHDELLTTAWRLVGQPDRGRNE